MAENAATGLDTEPASTRRLATRTRLIHAATAEIAERGFHGTSIEHIAERAGFTRGAFYSNFESKEQLFADALEACRADLLLDLDAQLAATALPIEAPDAIDPVGVQAAIEHVLLSLPKDVTWYVLNVEADLLAARDPAFAAMTRESASRFLDDLGGLVERTVAEHGLRFTIAAGQVIRVLFGYFSTALREAVLEGRADEVWMSNEQQASTVTQLLIAMVEPA